MGAPGPSAAVGGPISSCCGAIGNIVSTRIVEPGTNSLNRNNHRVRTFILRDMGPEPRVAPEDLGIRNPDLPGFP